MSGNVSNLKSDEVVKTKAVPDDIICKDCANKIGVNLQSNNYHKISCKVYEYPDQKPLGILIHGDKCEHYEKEK